MSNENTLATAAPAAAHPHHIPAPETPIDEAAAGESPQPATEPVHQTEPGPVAAASASEMAEVEEMIVEEEQAEEDTVGDEFGKSDEALEEDFGKEERADLADAGSPTVLDEAAAAESEPPAPAEPAAPPAPSKRWYVVKVQSNREDTIKAAIERKVKIEGLEELYGQIAVPVEEYMEKKKVKTTDKKTGEKVTQEKTVAKHRKKFPGYIFAEVQYDDRILYLFRETSGVGDFVGASLHRAPTPMTDREVEAMLSGIPQPGRGGKSVKKILKIDIEKGDKVRVRDGAFSGMEGEVKLITEPKEDETPKVTVVVTVFGRPVDVTLDYWQVDKA